MKSMVAIVAAVVGAIIGLCFGFITTRRMDIVQFGDWLVYPVLGGGPLNALIWAVMGAVVLAGLAYVSGLTRR